jgi:hypothetical protein
MQFASLFMPMVMKSPGLKPIEAKNAKSSSACVPYSASMRQKPVHRHSERFRNSLIVNSGRHTYAIFCDTAVSHGRGENPSTGCLQLPRGFVELRLEPCVGPEQSRGNDDSSCRPNDRAIFSPSASRTVTAELVVAGWFHSPSKSSPTWAIEDSIGRCGNCDT